MNPYICINGHHIGKSHFVNGLACEDYSLVYSDESVSIIAISDGHGDKNCFRSAKGAKFACTIGISACRQFQLITNHINDIEQCDFNELVCSLKLDIVNKWKQAVLDDAATYPFSEKELSIASAQAQDAYKNGQRIEKAYGCTLIISMATASYWLALQIGDGKCIAAYSDGVFIEPVPNDENCLGNRSTSLCNSNAMESFRHYYSRVMPLAVFVSSDGVEESFDQEGLYNCFYSIAYWLKESGCEVTKEKVDNLLPQISEGGSGDDVSLAIMASSKETLSKPRQTLDQVYERVNAWATAVEQYRNRLSGQKDRLEEINEELTSLDDEIKEIQALLSEKSEKRRLLVSEQETVGNSVKELSDKLNRANEQMERANKYKLSAEKYWFSEYEKLKIDYQSRKSDDTPDKGQEDVTDDTTELFSGSNNEETITQHDGLEQENSVDTNSNGVAVEKEAIKTEGQNDPEKRPRRLWPFSKQ